jgi:hypothetical protein
MLEAEGVVDKRYEDDRARKRVVSGLGTGGGFGAVLGLLTGVVVSGFGILVVTAMGGVAGAAIGRAVAKRVSLEEWDSSMVQRPYVGAHAPDSEETKT